MPSCKITCEKAFMIKVMKIKIIAIIFFSMFSNSFKAQRNYSLGLSTGSGLNIYKNQGTTDSNHFSFKNSVSLFVGARILKNLDEKNNLFVDILYERKKIELEYSLNEPEIPFENQEIAGQKYSCLSFFFGYRRQIIDFNSFSTYVEAGVGSDYNVNTISSNRGNGGTTDDISEPIYYENISNTNLGEKSFTISTNLGFGFNFGHRNQFDAGLLLNIPFQKIQSKNSEYQYLWKYQGKEYIHKIEYIGKVYYPSLKLTYYFF